MVNERGCKPMNDESYRNEILQKLEELRVEETKNAESLATTSGDEDQRVQRDALMEARQDFKKQKAELLARLDLSDEQFAALTRSR
jgi:hypothetical protein